MPVMSGGGKRKTGAAVAEQCEKAAKDVKKRRSNQADIPDTLRQEVESLYRLGMPDDFYHFWMFCQELDPKKPCDVFKSSLGLQLVGPYDILAGKHKISKRSSELDYNLHYRFFYDPPEFQTILVGDHKTQHHMGYFRLFLSKKLKEVKDKKLCTVLKDLDGKLSRAAEEFGYSLEQKSAKMKQRDKKVVTKSFHGAGLMVVVDKNDVGYRELPETDASLKKICKAIAEAPSDDIRMKAFAPIQEMMTFIQFANDECDYGMGYELGIDLFCYGSHYFHKIVGQLLPLAYNLLKRNLFAEIISAHLSSRTEENVDQLTA
ncbi:histone PARylation factor 1 isoform X3 [Ambystoma mexicanum]|uniref:histone PARylation factor 1 isoform X3 n=1 Tax=Ambystoma mexicanum TaxID=8296 RepID=UPI0037E89CDF